MTRGERARRPAAGTPAPPHPSVPPWIGDVIAAILVAGAAFAPFPGAEFRPDGWAQTLLVLSPAAALPFRRRWPVPVLAVCLAIYGAASAVGILAPGAALAVAIAMFGTANRSNRRTTVIIGTVAVAVVFLFSIPAAAQHVLEPRVFQFVLAVAFAAAAGDGTRSRREYIAAITERAERAEQTREAEARRRVSEERLRIARDLHDAVAHQIAVISLNAGAATAALETNPDRAREALGTIRGAARTVLGEIGDLMTMLRADEPEGSVAAPLHGLENLDGLLDQFRTSGLDVHTRIEGDLAPVTGAVGLVAYRVIQEGLTNAHKHGAEHRAHLLLESSRGSLRIIVTNPAAPPSVGGGAPGSGVGLVGLRERVAAVRGTVQAGPAPGGYRLAAEIPIPKEESA